MKSYLLENMMKEKLTTAAGYPIADNQNSRSAGPRGPLLLEDFYLLEKLAHFNRERIPERVVHAKGSAAYGTLTITHDISQYTKADLFNGIGKQTSLFLRFSTVGGEKGSADTVRDPRGFAIKFYTNEGVWDLVGNNTPVFFLRDPLKFPDFIHTQKRDPQTNMKSAQMVWDFASLSPETLHQFTILFSDRGLPDGYRHMDGFGSHTYSLINAKGERFWCKWHFKTQQGIKNLSNAEANRLAGEDPDYSQRDLFNAIAHGDFPKWTMSVQVMPEKDALDYAINPFDLTKVWPHKDYPLIEVATLELNRNPENYFAEVEQSAFAPSQIVPGLGFSPDKMLQGRLFAYADAHRYRLGINHHQIPVNKPTCPFHNNHRDGGMRTDGNGGSAPHYEPSCSAHSLQESAAYKEPALSLGDNVWSDHFNHRVDEDYYSQAGNLFRLMSPEQQQLLINNIVDSLKGADIETQKRQVEHFFKADAAYGRGVQELLAIL
jgi:catalase